MQLKSKNINGVKDKQKNKQPYCNLNTVRELRRRSVFSVVFTFSHSSLAVFAFLVYILSVSYSLCWCSSLCPSHFPLSLFSVIEYRQSQLPNLFPALSPSVCLALPFTPSGLHRRLSRLSMWVASPHSCQA